MNPTEAIKEAIRGALKNIEGNVVVMKRSYHTDATTSIMVCHANGKEMNQFAIELPDRDNQVKISCINEGVYNVVRHVSPKFKDCFHVLDVPGRTEILFHALNYVYDDIDDGVDLVQSEGCIGPAKGLADINKDGHIDGTSSKKALDDLLALYPKGFKLIITS